MLQKSYYNYCGIDCRTPKEEGKCLIQRLFQSRQKVAWTREGELDMFRSGGVGNTF